MRVISGTTNALPMQKYRNFSGIPVFVQPSGKPFNLSHSIGVRKRYFPVFGSSMMCVERFVLDSLVSMVRDGRSNGSGNAIGPSEKVYG